MNIGQAIVTIRKARKMTQKELAERCGMDYDYKEGRLSFYGLIAF